MNAKKLILKAQSYDNEDMTFELKRTEKYYKDNTPCYDELLKTIIGMANRDGGYIVIGINDDGTPEGKNIFDKFTVGSKSGIDSFKGSVNSKCLSKISPVINLVIDYFQDEEYEIAWIEIPQKTLMPHALVSRKGDEIESRKYYIKDSHSCRMVTDTQLEWLFNSKNMDEEIQHFNIHITTYANCGGIPIKIGKNDHYILQPNATGQLSKFFRYLRNRPNRDDNDYFNYMHELISEMLIYGVFQTLDGYGAFRTIPSKAIKIPKPTDEFLLGKEIEGNEFELYNGFHNGILLPENSRVSIRKIEKPSKRTKCIIENEFMHIEFEVGFVGSALGLSGYNPYSGIFIDNHGYEGQEMLHKHYETYQFDLQTRIKRIFPKVMTKEYNETKTFIDSFNNRIKVMWDIEYFFKNYPHYRTNYALEYKFDQFFAKNQTKTAQKFANLGSVLFE